MLSVERWPQSRYCSLFADAGDEPRQTVADQLDLIILTCMAVEGELSVLAVEQLQLT